MEKAGPELTRLTVDVDPQHMAELRAALGDFAVQHGTILHITEGTPDIPEVEEPQYNSELVTWVNDPETGARVAIVTESDLYRFAIAHGYSPNFPRRPYHALQRAVDGEDVNGGPTRYYLYLNPVGAKSLLASKLPELVDALVDGRLRVGGIRATSIQLLGEYVQALYQTETEDK